MPLCVKLVYHRYMEPKIPLAERMRPSNLADVIGHGYLLDEGALLRAIIERKEPVSLILWGPPGCGKTTLARIIAQEMDAECIELSAVTSGKKDIERVVSHARQNWNLQLRTVLFVDEIHRFNKAQQDAFLPHVESGLLTLIGATTENPSFEVISPLLSRSRVIVLQPLSKDSIISILQRALTQTKTASRVNNDALDFIAEASGGDARVALGSLELALATGGSTVTRADAEAAVTKKLPGYDKNGDAHYAIISAFIKSMRAGDDSASLYYLARMLQAGEDPLFIARRMIIFASEDIGLAGNGALGLALDAFSAVERIGMPEAQYVLYHTVTALARAKKSRETTNAMHAAKDLAEKTAHLEVPVHLRNASTSLMKDLGYAKDYSWDAGFIHEKGYFPDDLRGTNFFVS